MGLQFYVFGNSGRDQIWVAMLGEVAWIVSGQIESLLTASSEKPSLPGDHRNKHSPHKSSFKRPRFIIRIASQRSSLLKVPPSWYELSQLASIHLSVPVHHISQGN